MFKTFDLPCMDTRASFYGKAIVREYLNRADLVSYQTIVGKILFNDDGTKTFIRLWGGHSQTTLRHVNSFLTFYGLSALDGKKEWDKLSVSNA